MRAVSSIDPEVVRGLYAVASPWIVAIVVAIVIAIVAITVVVILISIVHCRECL